MKTEYTLTAVADLTGKPVSTLRTMAARGSLPTIKIPYGQNRFKLGVTADVLVSLLKEDTDDSYTECVKEYLHRLKRGTLGGRNRPATQRHVDEMAVYLDRYWSVLGKKPSVEAVNVDNFRAVMESFKVDEVSRQDFYSIKTKIYTVITGLMKVLIEKGYKSFDDDVRIRKQKPHKRFSLVKPWLEYEEIKDLIIFNQAWGRSYYSIQVTDILIALYAYGGLRRHEAIALKLNSVNKDHLLVYGKFSKERIVPIFPELKPHLEEWLKARQNFIEKKGYRTDILIPSEDGEPLTNTAINTRFQRLRKALKDRSISYADNVKPHALRRACATVAALNGMPDVLIQKMLGHSRSSTTDGYKMVTEKHLIQWAKTQGVKQPETVELEKPKPNKPNKFR